MTGPPRLRATTHRPTTHLVAALAVLASALALVAAGPSGPAGAQAPSGDPGYQRPQVGECRDYSLKHLAHPSESSTPVSCDAEHTALTVAVVDLPARVKVNPKPGHQANVFRAVAKQCYAATATTLGGSAKLQAKTAFAFGYFVPTKDQLAQGARWVRCDLILQGGRRLNPLPTPLLGSLTNATQRCILVSGKQVLTTSCDRPHGFRSSRTVVLPGHGYPGVKALQSAARRTCALRAGVGWFASWPGAADWTYGHHRQLVCYRQTTS